MKDTIEQRLTAIEDNYHVKIVYACESGSRAWGFASKDSDYDVRFIYAHPADWYLSITKKRDVIEDINDGLLDINGWDIRKALGLLRNSNAPLREWLHSPIVYRSLDAIIQPVMELAQQSLMPASLCYHYVAMARKTFSIIQQGEKAKIKSYLYTLRPLLCCQWIIQHNTQPPMRIQVLLSEFLQNHTDEIRQYIDELIEKKSGGNESTHIERNQVFEGYIINQFVNIESRIPRNPKKQPIELFDQIFRQIVKEEL